MWFRGVASNQPGRADRNSSVAALPPLFRRLTRRLPYSGCDGDESRSRIRLATFQVKKFRNVVDSTPIEIEPGVSCLVGKNESGKMAILHTLYRLNPARENVRFDTQANYPAWLQKKDQLGGIELEEVIPIEATFELDEADVKRADDLFDPGLLVRGQTVIVRRTYDGVLSQPRSGLSHAQEGTGH